MKKKILTTIILVSKHIEICEYGRGLKSKEMEDFIEIFDEIEDDYDVEMRLPRIIHNRDDHFEKWDESSIFLPLYDIL